MSTKAFFWASLVLLVCVALSSTASADSSLVGWWKLDDGAGTIAKDSSGLGNDGTLGGGTTWVAGKMGGALQLASGYVIIDKVRPYLTSTDLTISAWVKFTATAEGEVVSTNDDSGGHPLLFGTWNGTAFTNDGGTDRYFGPTINDNQWHMITFVRSGSTGTIYVDGVATTPYTSSFSLTTVTKLSIGQEWDPPSPSDFYNGTVDDVRIYNRTLSAGEIASVMKGEVGLASALSPADKATDVPRDAVLSWTAGQYAKTHDVYFGTVSADVNTASETSAKGVLASQGQADTTFDPPGSLAYGQTYYWRLDEINAPPSSTVFKGNVWSFTAEPYSYPITGVTATASSSQPGMGPEKTIDGSGLTGDQHSNDPMTMWLSTGVLPNWVQYQFDAVYKLDKLMVWNSNQMIEAYLGFGAKDVTVEYSVDGTTWTAVAGVPQFAQGTGSATYAANTTVNFGGVSAKFVKLTIDKTYGGMPTAGLSEVRFLYVPLQARSPQPANAATGVAVDGTLSWRPGREAGSHQVFVSADQAAVTGGTATAQTVTDHSFAPSGLAFATTYYWRVDEVNTATTPGAVWSFTTEPYAVVDDFESYDDTGNLIFDTWIDGLADGKSGSQVGYNNAPFAELTIIHGGAKSMPFSYSNTGAVTTSEATRTFSPAQDWTRGGAKTLVLYFYGDPANSAGQMYAKINGTKVSYSGANTVQTAGWGQWNIDLAATGVSLKAVKTLTVGVQGSGTGKLLFDDLRLYANAPAMPVGAALDIKLAAVTDDMEEYVTDGAMQTTSTDLEMPYENSGTPPTQPQLIGLRYLLTQPKGAKISKAYVEFTCDETKGGTQPVNLIIQGQLIASAPAFLSTAKNISSRTPLTKAQVSWAVENWTTVGQKSQTPDITPILQELVNQSGWVSGNAIVLIISDDKSKPSTGVRCADAMEDQANGAGTAPVLHIEVAP